MRRRLVFAAASVSIIALLVVWMLLPYFFPLEYHAIDIKWEYRNYLMFWVTSNFDSVRGLVPSKISLSTDANVFFELGLLHVEIEGKSYDAVSLMLKTSSLPSGSIKAPSVFKPQIAGWYVLGFFTNNSELGDVLRSYGFPHTFVQATYQRVDEGVANRTTLTMTCPDGTVLADILYTTSGQVRNPPRPGYAQNSYCLRNDNLTVLHLMPEAGNFDIFDPEGIGHLNMTTSEGSVIWSALNDLDYVMNISLREAFPLYRMSGKIGWTERRD